MASAILQTFPLFLPEVGKQKKIQRQMLHDSPTSSAQSVDEGPRQRIGSMIVNQVALVFNKNGIK
jgi:hypothetical protein